MTPLERIRWLAELAGREDVPLKDRSAAVAALDAERSNVLGSYDQSNPINPDLGNLLSGDAAAVAEKFKALDKHLPEASNDINDTIARYDQIPADVRAQFPDMTPSNAAALAMRDATMNAGEDYQYAHLGENYPASNKLYDAIGLSDNAKRWVHPGRQLASTVAGFVFPESLAGIATQIPINALDTVDAVPALKHLFGTHPKTATGIGVADVGSQVPDWLAVAKAMKRAIP